MDPLFARRTIVNQIDATTRLCVRTAVAQRLFPSGRALFDTADLKEAVSKSAGSVTVDVVVQPFGSPGPDSGHCRSPS